MTVLLKMDFLPFFSRRIVLAGLALAAMGAAGGMSASAQDAEWNQVVEAAKAEGTVVIYTARVGDPNTKAVADAFTAEYGIQVDVLEARASEIRERIRIEHASGRVVADVVFTADAQIKLYANEDNTVDPIPPSPAQANINEAFISEPAVAPVFVLPYGILVNTNLVPEGEMPESWADLTDPKWRGKLLVDDPRAVGGGYAWFYVTDEKLGQDYNTQMAQQDLLFTRDQRESQRRVSRGEYAMYFPVVLPDIISLRGLPVRVVVPEEGVPYVLYSSGMLKNAPHPNAARLYIDFIQSPQAQAIYAASGNTPVVEGMGEGLPDDIREIVEAELFGTIDPARQAEMLAKAREIYGD